MTRTVPVASIRLRPQTDRDEPTVRRAHVDHRRRLLGGLGWPQDAMERLCIQQHDLQERHIALHHPEAERWMIRMGGRTVGRLCLDLSGSPWRIIDLAVLPEEQGRGAGSAVLRDLQRRAAEDGASIELQVGIDNPRAEALYRRVGFRDGLGCSPTHRRMIWSVS